MSTQYRLVQSGKTASGGCSAGQGSSEPVAPRKKGPLLLHFVLMLSPKYTIIFLQLTKFAINSLPSMSSMYDMHKMST
jgi:hypothetical protein